MQRGFTLIELIIAIAVISIIAGLALPVAGETLAKQRIDTAAHILEADIRSVQQMCINTTPDTIFPTIKPLSNKYIIKKGSNIIKSIDLPSGVNLSGPETLTFGMDGTPLTDGQPLPTTLLMTSNDTSLIKKVVVSSAGRVRVE